MARAWTEEAELEVHWVKFEYSDYPEKRWEEKEVSKPFASHIHQSVLVVHILVAG